MTASPSGRIPLRIRISDSFSVGGLNSTVAILATSHGLVFLQTVPYDAAKESRHAKTCTDQQLRQQGMDLKLYFQYTGMDMDSFRDTYRDRAEGEVKLRLALEKIAELEAIEVSEEEINDSLSEMAAANNMDVDTIKRFINVADFADDLKVQKAVDLVKETAVVDNTPAEEAADAE